MLIAALAVLPLLAWLAASRASVTVIEDPLRGLPWKNYGSRSYALSILPVDCKPHVCFLAKAWWFSPYSGAGGTSTFEVGCGSHRLSVPLPLYRDGIYLYAGTIFVRCSAPSCTVAVEGRGNRVEAQVSAGDYRAKLYGDSNMYVVALGIHTRGGVWESVSNGNRTVMYRPIPCDHGLAVLVRAQVPAGLGECRIEAYSGSSGVAAPIRVLAVGGQYWTEDLLVITRGDSCSVRICGLAFSVKG